MTAAEFRPMMADLAASFHWSLSELKGMAIDEMVDYWNLAKDKRLISPRGSN